jgi:hypothetical protein
VLKFEPYLMQLARIDIFAAGEEWARLRRPGAIETPPAFATALRAWRGRLRPWAPAILAPAARTFGRTGRRALAHRGLVS